MRSRMAGLVSALDRCQPISRRRDPRTEDGSASVAAPKAKTITTTVRKAKPLARVPCLKPGSQASSYALKHLKLEALRERQIAEGEKLSGTWVLTSAISLLTSMTSDSYT